MENQVNETVTDQAQAPSGSNANTLDVVSAVGLVGGAIAPFFIQNVAAVSIPIAAAVGIHIYNRRQLAVEMSQKQETAIAALVGQMNQQQTALTEYLQKSQQETAMQLQQQGQTQAKDRQALSQSLGQQAEMFKQQLAALQGETQQSQDGIKEDHQQLVGVVTVLREMVNHSHTIEADPKSDAYYQRGLNHQALGDRVEAQRDFSEAIRLNAELAGAYFQRGVIYAEQGNRKPAVEDLRQAAKLYFEQGDLDHYHRARDLGKEFYDLQHPFPGADLQMETPEPVAIAPKDGDQDESIKPLLEKESEVTAGNLFD
ncbi:MAG: tetratricopeptide repeat protein [Microcystaceae cyanobacterium]